MENDNQNAILITVINSIRKNKNIPVQLPKTVPLIFKQKLSKVKRKINKDLREIGINDKKELYRKRQFKRKTYFFPNEITSSEGKKSRNSPDPLKENLTNNA